MGIGVSTFLIAVGAILAFAVNVTITGIDLDTVGVILMIVGVLGLLLSLVFWSSWGGFGGYRRDTGRSRSVRSPPAVLGRRPASIRKGRPEGRPFCAEKATKPESDGPLPVAV